MNPNREDTTAGRSESKSKLKQVIDKYDFDGLGEQIEDYWLADTGDRYSLRELAEYVNHYLLRRSMHDAGMDPLNGEIENTYRLLTADDVSTGVRTQTRRRLERAGVDVDQLEVDFVSRQAVHTYLTKDRGVNYSSNVDDRITKQTATIQGLKRRLTATVQSKLEWLQNVEDISLGEFEVLLDVSVLCKDCGAQYQIDEFLERRTCECTQEN